jgi:hypothetical protein
MPTTTATSQAAHIQPGEPIVVTVSPPGENRWGFYQFPDMWRAPGGEIYLAVNVGSDSEIGEHVPSAVFVSDGNGRAWRETQWNKVDLSPLPITFSDGSQVTFGDTVYVYHVHGYGELMQPWQWLELDGTGIEPVSDYITDSYQNNEHLIYRANDLPAAFTTFLRRWRALPDEPWQRGTASFDSRNLYFWALGRARWWDVEGQPVAEEMPRRIFRPWPRHGQVVKLPDDTLVWAAMTLNPVSVERNHLFFGVVLLASTDRGQTWQQRGIVTYDTERATDGYSGQEHSLQRLPNGDLLCVMRTEMGDKPGCSRFLAVARSTDNGYTWSAVEELAPFSVTPLLMTLDNGTVAVAYGRPGVYVKASADSGHTWTDAYSVVGPSEAELLADRWWDVRYDHYSGNKISCGNLGEVVTGPDRFLLAYSDLRHHNAAGEQCKAVKVQEFTISAY